MLSIFENVSDLDRDHHFISKIVPICYIMWNNRYKSYSGWDDPLKFIQGVIGDCISKLALAMEDVNDLSEFVQDKSGTYGDRGLFTALNTLETAIWLRNTDLGDKVAKEFERFEADGYPIDTGISEISRILEIEPSRVIPRTRQGYISSIYIKNMFVYYLMISILKRGLGGDFVEFKPGFYPTSKSGVRYVLDGYTILDSTPYLIKCNTLQFNPLSQLTYIVYVLDEIDFNSAMIFLKHPSIESIFLEARLSREGKSIASFSLHDLAQMLRIFKHDFLYKYIWDKVVV